jgi:hypothetical protein
VRPADEEGPPLLPEALSRAGSDGWELTVAHTIEERQAVYVFKRPRVEG